MDTSGAEDAGRWAEESELREVFRYDTNSNNGGYMNYLDIKKKISKLQPQEMMEIAYECYDGEMEFEEFEDVVFFEADQTGDDISLHLLKELRMLADDCGQAERISLLANDYLPKLQAM